MTTRVLATYSTLNNTVNDIGWRLEHMLKSPPDLGDAVPDPRTEIIVAWSDHRYFSGARVLSVEVPVNGNRLNDPVYRDELVREGKRAAYEFLKAEESPL